MSTTTSPFIVGRRYYARSGKIVRILCVDRNAKQPVVAVGADGDLDTHNLDGSWSTFGSKTSKDILPDRPADLPEHPPAKETDKPVLIFKLGKFYRTRDGKKARCVADGASGLLPLCFKHIDSQETRPHFITGATSREESTMNDIVAEWTEDVQTPCVFEVGKYYVTGARDRVRCLATDCKLFTSAPIVVMRDDGSTYHVTENGKCEQLSHSVRGPWVERPSGHDRRNYPAWAKWIARGQHAWYWFSDQPVLSGNNGWRCVGGSHGVIPPEFAPTFDGDWKDSLTALYLGVR